MDSGNITESTAPSSLEQALSDAGVVRQISFRAALLAKLNLIVWAAKSKKAAAKAIGVPRSTICRWYADDTSALEYRNLIKVDTAYRIAFEKREIHEGRLARRRAKRRKLATPDMHFSVDAV